MRLKEEDVKFINPLVYKIFELVKNKSKIANIESKSRIPELVMTRRVYFALCKKFIPISPMTAYGYVCGKRDHTTVLHNIIEFHKNYDSGYFEHYKELYLDCYNEIKKWDSIINKDLYNDIDGLNDLKETYRIRLKKYQLKTRILVDSMSRKLKTLRTREVFGEIAALDEDDLNDFELRAKAFFINEENKK